MRRGFLILFFLAVPLVASAQDVGGGIDVIDVSGPLDASALQFMADSIEDAAATGQVLAVLQINSKAVLDEEGLERVASLVANPPLPLAVWVGPAPATAYGGAALLVTESAEAAIAPGSQIGRLDPVVVGEDDSVSSEVQSAEESGLRLQPTLRQYLQELDGAEMWTRDGPVTVTTIRDFEGGVTLKETTFIKPGLGTRFFRLAVTPEAALFFLLVGLSIVTFEFYALGPGVAAGVAAISLMLGGWGVLNLPTNWWALALVLLGWALLTAAHQKGGLVFLTVVGSVMLQVAGMNLVDGGGQIDPRWYLVLPSVLAVLFFFLIAMPTVQRARLSTPTIGRDALIGRTGVAIADFDPDGTVEVGGARWRATAHREAKLDAGSQITVTGVDGLFLEVDRLEEDREN